MKSSTKFLPKLLKIKARFVRLTPSKEVNKITQVAVKQYFVNLKQNSIAGSIPAHASNLLWHVENLTRLGSMFCSASCSFRRYALRSHIRLKLLARSGTKSRRLSRPHL